MPTRSRRRTGYSTGAVEKDVDHDVIGYSPNPVPEDEQDLRRFIDDELHKIRGSFDEIIDIEPSAWDDLRFPGVTGKSLPGKEPGLSSNGLLLFDASRTESIAFLAQMPHAWKEESTIRPHVHWMKTTSAANDVVWQLEYKWASISEVMDVAFTTSTVSTPVNTDNDTAEEHLISLFADIDATGKEISDCLIMIVSRLGGDGSDTYGADVSMLEFDLHYQIDAFGSFEEYVK